MQMRMSGHLAGFWFWRATLALQQIFSAAEIRLESDPVTSPVFIGEKDRSCLVGAVGIEPTTYGSP